MPLSRLKVTMSIGCLVLSAMASAQSAGANSPATTTNDATVGSNSWTSPVLIMASDNTYSSVSSKGISNYLKATDFEFNIPTPSSVVGIQLDVERNTNGPSDVSLLDPWTIGLSRTISAGTNRCLVVAYAQENGTNSRDLTAMTYGGRSMTQVAEFAAGTSGAFMARLEIWVLFEPDIVLASNSTIVPTFGAYTALEYCDAFAAASFQNVDQLTPLFSQQTIGAQGTANPHQLATPFATLPGSMAIQLVTSGNRDSSNPSPNTNTNSYTTPTGYTEVVDYYYANATVAPTSGASLQVIQKVTTAAGTEAPPCTFNGSVNRYAILGVCLQRARELDHSIRLVKGGVIGGSDLATTTAWPTSDAYASYGGSTSLWGRTWTDADINSPGFGAAIATRVQNGEARIDHMRLTVWYFSTLPIELLDLRAMREGATVRVEWVTASERNNDHFIVQRSADGVSFEDVEQVAGAGTSQQTLFYNIVDQHPLEGMAYYRLKQVDTDGTADLSDAVAVNAQPTDGFLVAPNPSSTGTFTLYDVRLDRGEVAVFDNTMHLVRRHVGAGVNAVIHLEDLPDGVYILMVHEGDQVRTARVVKESRTR